MKVYFHVFMTIFIFLVSSSRGTLAAPLEEIDLPQFSSILNDKTLTGLRYELIEDQNLIRSQAKEFVLYFRGKLSDKKSEEILKECESQGKLIKNPFCVLILSPEKIERGSRRTRLSRIKHRAFIKDLIQKIKAGTLDALKEANSSDLNEAFKKVRAVKTLKPLIENVVKDQSCISSALLFALGLRVESEFPGEEFKSLAITLYQRAQKCGKDSNAFLSSYRLGLMQIWDGNYQDAEASLASIDIMAIEPSYRMRVGYWRYYCAVQMKNQTLKERLKNWLLREYPLSLHGLLANSDSPESLEKIVNDHDPIIIFRSERDIELNHLTRAVEALLAENEIHLASNILIANSSNLQQAGEPPFQLYWAVLMERAGERPAGFDLMAKIFRENPRLISKDALALMYPLRESKPIGEWASAVDPYLVLSVIRQESAFNVRARSSAGALGLMQLQPSTARTLERISNDQLWKPHVNIRVGVKYLKRLLSSFDGEVELALAAYNAGPGRIREWLKRYPVKNNRLLFLDLLPIRETRDYVSAIARNYYWYSKLYEKAFAVTEASKKVRIQGPLILSASIQSASSDPSPAPASDPANRMPSAK